MGFDKIWAELAGRPLLSHALSVLALARQPTLDQIVLVVAESRRDAASELVRPYRPRAIVCSGGALRRDSVAAGLSALAALDWVIVHDAARPFLTPELLERGLLAARETGAAVAAVPARDTVKRVADGLVVETPPRSELWLTQTPQIFRADLLTRALARADPDVTDEATLVERSGGRVRVFAGDDANWKVTTPADFALAEAWLAFRGASAARRGGRGAVA
jgi:2-C-methyl-D-erythritol 4-phosphate cytidylyltransferase